MANGKIRHSNHLVDQQACRHLLSVLPQEWIQRTMNPDYGLDIDLELFGYESGICVTLGEHVYLQVKGTEHATYGTIRPFGNAIHTVAKRTDISWPVLKFSIEVSELLLVERMEAAVPVLLVVVDLLKKQAYYVCLNDYIKYVLPYQNPKFRAQKTITIYIPIENKLTTETSDICLWYGKRAKLFSLFLESLSLADNVKYLHATDLVEMMRKRLSVLICSDAWKALEHWRLLEDVYGLIVTTEQDNLLNEAGRRFLETELGDNGNSDAVEFEYLGELISRLTAAQVASCLYLLEQISMTAYIFEDEARHKGLPTDINWFQTKQ